MPIRHCASWPIGCRSDAGQRPASIDLTMASKVSVLHRVLVLAGLTIAVTTCSFNGGTLGGREKCWSAGDPRAASLWRGTLQIDASGARLAAPEGDLVLLPGALSTRMGEGGVGELVRGSEGIARAGDIVTLFGGIGGDGTMVVCGLEEIHSS
jgi:hypothetical protein